MQRLGSQLVIFGSLIVVLFAFQNCNKAFSPAEMNRLKHTSLSSTSLEPIRILPLGDSLTYGVGSSSCDNGGCAGYRLPLYQSLKDDGVNFTLVGTESTGPDSLPEKNHEGHSGWRIDQITAIANSVITQTNPDIILLHIGSNDVAQQLNLPTAPQRLGELVDLITTLAPDVHLVVALVVPVQGNVYGYDTLIQNYNSGIEPILAQKQAQGKKVYTVNMYSTINSSFTSQDYAYSDPAHLSNIGYEKMAMRWKNALFDNAIIVPRSE